MIKKFSFWIVFVLICAISSMVFIHSRALQDLHLRTDRVQPLYQRQKELGSLHLSLEKYRRMTANFRKLTPGEIATIKDKLRLSFSEGVAQLDRLDPTPEERKSGHLLNDQLTEFLGLISQVEPMLFSKDSYQKADVVAIHDQIVKNLTHLEKSTESRIAALNLGSSRSESQSLILLLSVGSLIFILMICMIIRDQVVYLKPLKKLYLYAMDLKAGKSVPQHPAHFGGMHGEIQSALNQLALGVETHVRDRHKFILDIVSDLKSPLMMLQSGKYLLEGGSAPESNPELQSQAADAVRRGLAIFSGSLDELNDIVDINRLESKLEEKTVDLSELLSDVARTLVGGESAKESTKKISISVPPIPVWTSLDAKRFQRVFLQVFSKVMTTLPPQSHLLVSVNQMSHGSFRGVEVLIQDSERVKAGRTGTGGPEQDILKHWISETGLNMALAQKVIKVHGGSITASGVAGTSITVTIRLPQERVMSRGLISPPTEDPGLRSPGLVVQKALGSGDSKSAASISDL